MQTVRLRRLREKDFIRDWISETQLHPKHIILPYFVVEGENIRRELKSMSGVYHFSIDNVLKDLQQAYGIKAILLFGVTGGKNGLGSQAWNKDGIVQKAVRVIRKKYKDLIILTDVCLCGYTSHGHCGIIKGKRVENDETLKVLAKIALSHAKAGADFVAPSSMMDGQVKTIRDVLDEKGFKNVGIVAYSVKYASGFYWPFREALDSAPQFGDRKSYQMDFRNAGEALREIKQDIDEGADMVMVKPALAYLDIIYRAKEKFNIPVVAYNVSGEYSMIKKVSVGDKSMEKELALEVLTSIKRAGADLIISYFGGRIGKWLC